MDTNFDQCFRWLLEHEGGVTNLKNDRGGLTNLGVTHEEYDRYRRFKGLALRSVMLITREEAEDIYRQFYWLTLQCDRLAPGVDNVVFDMGVNNGVAGAAKAAQRVASRLSGKPIVVDGHIGPISLDAIDDCPVVGFIDAFCDERLRIDSTFFNWGTFGRAWTNRVNGNAKLGITGVRQQSKYLASKADVASNATAQKPPLPVNVSAPGKTNLLDMVLCAIAKLLRLA